MTLPKMPPRPAGRAWIIVAVVSVLLVIVIPIVVWKGWPFQRSGVVSVNARSESVEIDFDATRPRAHWYVSSATVALDAGKSQPFRGEVEPGPDARVRFERVGSGDLYLVFSAKGAGIAARLVPDSTEAPLTARKTLELKVRAAHAADNPFPFYGRVVIGDLVGPQTRLGAPLLLEGSVDIIGRAWTTDDRFVSGHADFRVGDQIEIAGTDGAIPSSVGFVRVDDHAGMQVTDDAAGSGVRTRRFGAADGFVLKASIFSRLKYDGYVAAIVGVFVLVLHIVFDESIKASLKVFRVRGGKLPAEPGS